MLVCFTENERHVVYVLLGKAITTVCVNAVQYI